MTQRDTSPGPKQNLRGAAPSRAGAGPETAAAARTRHAPSRAATAAPGRGGAPASSDWLGELTTPAAGERGASGAAAAGVPVDTTPANHRKGSAVESKRGAY